MKVKNFGFGMPARMNELWPWVMALDAWEYCDSEPLSALIKDCEVLPKEIAPAISEIVSGKRKQNKRGAAKLKIEAAERMKLAGCVSVLMGLIDTMKFECLNDDLVPDGMEGMADRICKEKIDIKSELENDAKNVIQETADEFNVSTETIENLLRDLRKKIKAWPSV